MADSIRDIKRRMKSIESTEHITNAMRLASAAKFRKAKSRFDAAEGALEEAMNAIGRVSGLGGAEPAPSGGRYLYIVISSSKGLCGSYNSALIKTAHDAIDDEKSKETKICAIGSKGADFFKRLGYDVLYVYEGESERFTFEDARNAAKPAVAEYLKGAVDRIFLVQTVYYNSLKQEAAVKQILPIKEALADMEFVPDQQTMAEYLPVKYLELSIYRGVIESSVCEHASRRSAMENAAQSAEDMLKSLSLVYNRARQQAVTNELIEIVAGAEAQR